ncbi:MAG: hypothetical protein ABSG53_11295 [Thermoguttaceae bacterium]|jgi:chromosomal replication initiation ATPase DnaA
MGRAVAAYLAWRRFGYPMAVIARALGDRGHSGLRTAVARIEAAGRSIYATLATLEKQLANV